VSSKTTLNQTKQIERVVLENNPESDTKNREVSSKTSLNQTLQIERGVLKNNSESYTTNRERCRQKHL
jgi:hypothetical protein